MAAGKPKIIQWLGIIAIIITGLIHLIEAPDAFSDAAYKGWLFCLNGLGALLAASGIYLQRKAWGWNLGFLIAALSIILYVLSRTAGLPNIPAEPENWLEPLGVASLFAEGIFVILFIRQAQTEKRI